jgi:hypothetical protein
MSAPQRHRAIPASVPEENVTVSPLDLHMEMFDMRSGNVWLCQQPLTMDEYRAFKPEPPYVKSGIARSAMSFAYFRRSPGAVADGALERRQIAGRDFVRVARPVKFRGLQPGTAPTRLEIDKHHVIGFSAGDCVPFVRLPDGQCYVQQTVAADHSRIDLPEDWTPLHVRLTQDWALALEAPATVYFFSNLQSYQGPVPAECMPIDPLCEGSGD